MKRSELDHVTFVNFEQGLVLQRKVLNLDSLSAFLHYISSILAVLPAGCLLAHIPQERTGLLFTVPSNSLGVPLIGPP